MTNRFEAQQFLVRKKVFTLFGASFHVYDAQGNVVLYSRQKAFKLREDIRLYTGEDMQTEVLSIQARQIIDFSVAYDVYDSMTGEKAGALRRRGFRSIIQDKWEILDPQDHLIGEISEDSMALALVRRFLTNLVPQTFEATVQNQRVCTFRQRFNPFILKLEVDFSSDTQGIFDRRLGLAAAILLCAIEGRQQ